MQPFTLNQAIVAGLLFLIGLFIGMFLLAGGKWKRRYKAEHDRVRELEAEVQHLGRENREFHTLRDRAERHPASGPLAGGTSTTTTETVRRDDRPVAPRHDGPEVADERGWRRVRDTDGDPRT